MRTINIYLTNGHVVQVEVGGDEEAAVLMSRIASAKSDGYDFIPVDSSYVNLSNVCSMELDGETPSPETGGLREKYRITRDDLLEMGRLRRKWAYDDYKAVTDGDPELPELNDEQVERVLDEYVESMYYRKNDWELEIENDLMRDAIRKAVER